ncbi:MAG TPA: glycosyltransferase family 39 protein [Bacteroidales bacterium]|nr:glycosyltransferase family 39 protein [Bacteroidales bacterium]HRZ47939.1 glycosyltransferase family 39 protein [Bacteroidales bacterium]
MTVSHRYLRIAFYLLWVTAAVLQALFTPLMADEAYYWMFSQHPAAGYFEHPPMVAFFIGIGYAILPNALGVRILSIIATTLSIGLLERLLKPEKPLLFYGLVASAALLHGIGFLAVPDAALLFFSLIFYLLFVKFTEKPSAIRAILFGLAAAALLLSKYHGILVIAFVVFSRIGILRKRFFWLVPLVALIALLPHLFWLIQNDFPTVQFHLLERNPMPRSILFPALYLVAALFFSGPLTGPFLIWSGVKVKSGDPLTKAMQWVMWGVLLFFLLMSVNGPVEVYWLMPAVVPAVNLGYRYYSIYRNRLLQVLMPVSLVLILAGRVLITADVQRDYPFLKPLLKPFTDPRSWVDAVSRTAGTRPVAFMNSYQEASLYTFYSGKPAFSLNNVMGRRNQFNLLDFENRYRGQEVMLVPNFRVDHFDTIPGTDGSRRFAFMPDFQSFSHIQFRMISVPETVAAGEMFEIVVQPQSRLQQPFFPEPLPGGNPIISAQFIASQTMISEIDSICPLTGAMENRPIRLRLRAPDQPGDCTLYLSVKYAQFPPTINSRKIKIAVVSSREFSH